jgi:hypothetical protein
MQRRPICQYQKQYAVAPCCCVTVLLIATTLAILSILAGTHWLLQNLPPIADGQDPP